MKQRRGFTILELLVVVAIVAILAIIVVPQFIGAIEKSRDSRELAEINSVTKAAHLFYMNNGYYPTLQGDQPKFGDPKSIKFSTDGSGEGLVPKYLSKLPHFSYWYMDYKGKAYHVTNPIEDMGAPIQITLNPKLDFKDGETKDGIKYKTPYGVIKGKKENYPEVIVSEFKGTIEHPEAAYEYNGGGKEPEPEINTPPIPTITMNPASNITTSTDIVWGYTHVDAENDSIKAEEWKNKQSRYDAGEQTVELRVQDSRGLWSEWTTITFIVNHPINTYKTTSIGETFGFVMKDNGDVYAWGENAYGQYGNGTRVSSKSLVLIPDLHGAKQIATGVNFTIALMPDGRVLSSGDNLKGQLGDGTTKDHYSFSQITALSNVKKIEAGYYHCAALLNDGTVMTWGVNRIPYEYAAGYDFAGQLGNGSLFGLSANPTKVEGLTDITDIWISGNNCFAQQSDGTVYGWGENSFYLLGIGTSVDVSIPTVIPALYGAKEIRSANYDTFALMSDGTVKSWGRNLFGELGNGTTKANYTPTTISGLDNVTAISIGCSIANNRYGDGSAFFLLGDGTVKACGFNTTGQLGLGDRVNKTTPTLIPTLSNVKEIETGGQFQIARLYDGSIYTWGNSGNYGFGDGAYSIRETPQKVNIP